MQRYGVLVISHGSRSKQWVKLVDQAVADVSLPDGIPIYSSFLEIVKDRLIQDGITALEKLAVTNIIVVPLFVSSGSTHIDEISYALGIKPKPLLESDLQPLAIRARIHFCSPMEDDPDIAEILYAKIQDLSLNPSKEIVLLVGHGSKEKGFHLQWRRELESLAGQLKLRGGFAEADAAMLLPDQVVRKMRCWQKRKPDHAVVVAPLFLSEGYFTNQVIPKRLEGFEYRYQGKAMLPHPLVSRWIEKRIQSELQRP